MTPIMWFPLSMIPIFLFSILTADQKSKGGYVTAESPALVPTKYTV